MEWVAADPVGAVLPALLIVAWIALWLLRRPVWPRFFLTAAALAVLCFPAGALARRAEMDGLGCTPDNLCFSADGLDWWLNGVLGLLATCALAVLTPMVDFLLTLVRRRSAPPTAEQRPARGRP